MMSNSDKVIPVFVNMSIKASKKKEDFTLDHLYDKFSVNNISYKDGQMINTLTNKVIQKSYFFKIKTYGDNYPNGLYNKSIASTTSQKKNTLMPNLIPLGTACTVCNHAVHHSPNCAAPTERSLIITPEGLKHLSLDESSTDNKYTDIMKISKKIPKFQAKVISLLYKHNNNNYSAKISEKNNS